VGVGQNVLIDCYHKQTEAKTQQCFASTRSKSRRQPPTTDFIY
jgi:hypothetical protein